MKKFLTVVLLLMFVSMSFAQESVFYKGTFDDALKKAAKENKLIVIDFSADG